MPARCAPALYGQSAPLPTLATLIMYDRLLCPDWSLHHTTLLGLWACGLSKHVPQLPQPPWQGAGGGGGGGGQNGGHLSREESTLLYSLSYKPSYNSPFT